MADLDRWCRRVSLGAVLVTSSGCKWSANAQPPLNNPNPTFLTYANTGLEIVPGEYMVMFDGKTVPESSVAALATSLVAGSHGAVTHVLTKSVRGFSVKGLDDTWADATSRRNDVVMVRKNFRIYGKELRGNGFFNPVPWNLDRIDQRAPFTLDRDYRFKTGPVAPNALPVPIYVLDNGVNAGHPELQGASGSRVENVADVRGTNFAMCNGPASNHGTGIASIAAGVTLGITPTLIKNVKVLDHDLLGGCEGGSPNDVAMGLESAYLHITSHNLTAAVVNLSLGWYAQAPDVETQIANLQAQNVLVVAAGGNENQDASGFEPANLPGVLAVGAVDEAGARSVFSSTGASNFGATIALWAPGTNIKIASWPSGGNAGATDVASGTSQAAAHVSGAAALLWQQNPGMTAAQLRANLLGRATHYMLTNLGAGSSNVLLYVGEDAPIESARHTIPKASVDGDVQAMKTGSNLLYAAGGDPFGTGASSGPYAFAAYGAANIAGGPVWQVASGSNARGCVDVEPSGLGGAGNNGTFTYLACMGTHNGAREGEVIATREDGGLAWPQQRSWLGSGSSVRGITAGPATVPGGVQLLVFAIATRPKGTGTEVFVTSVDMTDGHQVGTVVLTAPGFNETFHQAVDLVLIDTVANGNTTTDLIAATYSDPPGPNKTFLWKLKPYPLGVTTFGEVAAPTLSTNGISATALTVQPLEDSPPQRIPGEVFLATSTAVNDGGHVVPWAYIYRLNAPDRVTASNIEVIKEAYVTSLWSEDNDLYFGGVTTRTFSPGDPFGVSKPGASPDYDAFLGKSEGISNSRRWTVGFDTPRVPPTNPPTGLPNSGVAIYGNKKGYIAGNDGNNFYVVQYPVY